MSGGQASVAVGGVGLPSLPSAKMPQLPGKTMPPEELLQYHSEPGTPGSQVCGAQRVAASEMFPEVIGVGARPKGRSGATAGSRAACQQGDQHRSPPNALD
jgi:hypothetical protein